MRNATNATRQTAPVCAGDAKAKAAAADVMMSSQLRSADSNRHRLGDIVWPVANLSDMAWSARCLS